MCRARRRVLVRRERAERQPEVVRPEQDREHALPKRQVKVADRKEPAEDPQRTSPRMLFDADSFHVPRQSHDRCQKKCTGFGITPVGHVIFFAVNVGISHMTRARFDAFGV
jgi:hypothetical protein